MKIVDYQKGFTPLVVVAIIAAVLVVGGGGYGYVTYQEKKEAQIELQRIAQAAQDQKILDLEEKLAQLSSAQTQATTSEERSQTQQENAEIQKQIDDLKRQNNILKGEATKKTTVPAPLPTAVVLSPPVVVTPGTHLSSSAIIAKVKPAVVSVGTRRGNGSGFIIGGTYVVTNAHVVEYVYRTTVGLNGGGTVTGYVVGRDDRHDIAVIMIPQRSVTPLAYGNSSESVVTQGDKVYAFGYPFGIAGDASFTEGSVSRRFTQDGNTYIEISNSIHPGNSGGPLVDGNGDVVGMNTGVIGTGIGGVIVGETIKFAIPSSVVSVEATRLINAAQPISLNGRGLIDQFEDFMIKLNAVDSDTDTVLLYRDYYVKEGNYLALEQLVASSTAVKDRANTLLLSVPAISFQNTLKAMAENRRDRAQTLVSIYETEMAIINGKLKHNVITLFEENLVKLDQKMINLNISYENIADQLHKTISTYTFY